MSKNFTQLGYGDFNVAPIPVTLAASGNQRYVFAVSRHQRDSDRVSEIYLNGVLGRLIILADSNDEGITEWADGSASWAMAAYYWLDEDLPFEAGTYDVTTNGSGSNRFVSVLGAVNAAQDAPVYSGYLQDSDLDNPIYTRTFPIEFEGENVSRLLVFRSSAGTPNSGFEYQTLFEGTPGVAIYEGDSHNDLNVPRDNPSSSALVGGLEIVWSEGASGPSISVPDIKGPNGAPIGNVNPVTVAIWDDPEANPDNTAPDALVTDAAIVDSVLDLNHETIAQNVRVRCRYVHEGSIRLFEVVTPVIQP